MTLNLESHQFSNKFSHDSMLEGFYRMIYVDLCFLQLKYSLLKYTLTYCKHVMCSTIGTFLYSVPLGYVQNFINIF